jgi:hypothetical protein
MMNLFIITYEGDFTQFIVDATDHDNPEQYAIQRAMEVNLLPELGTFNEEDIEEAKDSSMYELAKVDMQTLANKIRGDAIDGVYGGLFGDTIVIHN